MSPSSYRGYCPSQPAATPAHVCCCAWVLPLHQVALLIDQVDQYDQLQNAALKGIRSEPQQPELPKLRQALTAAKKLVLLAESHDVSASAAGGVLHLMQLIKQSVNHYLPMLWQRQPLICAARTARTGASKHSDLAAIQQKV